MTNSTEAEVTRLKRLIRKGYWTLAKMTVEFIIFAILVFTFLKASYLGEPNREQAFEFLVVILLLRLETKIK